MKLQSILVLCTTILSSSQLYAASFDCENAKTSAERTVCEDKDVSFLDESMSETYMELKNVLTKNEFSNIKNEQRKWLDTRNKECYNALSCLEIYSDRLNALKTILIRNKLKRQLSEHEGKSVNSLFFEDNLVDFIQLFFGNQRSN